MARNKQRKSKKLTQREKKLRRQVRQRKQYAYCGCPVCASMEQMKFTEQFQIGELTFTRLTPEQSAQLSALMDEMDAEQVWLTR